MPKRLSGLEKIEALGYTPREMVDYVEALPERCLPPRADATVESHEHKFRIFNEFIEDDYPNGITVNGQTVTTIQDWIEARLPFPGPDIIEGYLKFYVSLARGQIKKNEGKIKAKTLTDWWEIFVSAWNYANHRSNQVPQELHQYGRDMVGEIIRAESLSEDDPERAHLNKTSLIALQDKAMSPAFKRTLDDRINYVTIQAICTQAGQRPSSVVQPGHSQSEMNQDGMQARTGATFGTMTIQLRRADDPSHPNRIGGFFKPRWAKRRSSRNRQWPLPYGAQHIGGSAALMSLITLTLRGALPVDELEEMLSPEWIPVGQTWREYRIPNEWRDKLIFTNKKGKTFNTPRLSGWMKKLSVLCGFEKRATSYCFRHGATIALLANEETLANIRNFLGHPPTSRDTKSYVAKHSTRNGMSVMAGKSGKSTLRAIAYSSNAQPTSAPSVIDKRQREEIENLPSIKTKRRALTQLKTKIEAERSPDHQLMVKNATASLQKARVKERNNALEAAREAYFQNRSVDQIANGDPSPADSTGGPVSLSSETAETGSTSSRSADRDHRYFALRWAIMQPLESAYELIPILRDIISDRLAEGDSEDEEEDDTDESEGEDDFEDDESEDDSDAEDNENDGLAEENDC
ncbi:hypothetical protein I317_01580 [Kwoniella heveanensis CBS 569]|nr:hypothetical protein I317_01580 [Kwoniella heveanensis CBS 569]